MTGDGGPPGDERPRASAPGTRPSRIPNRVTLEFAGPPLALPPDALSPDALSPDALSPAALSPDALSPDAPSPDALSPAALSPAALSPAALSPAALPRVDVGPASEPLQLDTSELDDMPVPRPPSDIGEDGFLDPSLVAEDRGSEKLRLDLDELEPPGSVDAREPEDGWGRLARGSSRAAPPRPRSATPLSTVPPPLAREALDLVTRRSRPPSAPGLDLASEMADRYALGDYTGALRVAELVLGRDPNDLRAQRCAESSRERLLALYTARLGSVSGASTADVGVRVPEIVVPEHEIRWLGLDHRQGFVLSRLDGSATVDELVDVSGMSRLELLRTLVELVEAGAIRV